MIFFTWNGVNAQPQLRREREPIGEPCGSGETATIRQMGVILPVLSSFTICIKLTQKSQGSFLGILSELCRILRTYQFSSGSALEKSFLYPTSAGAHHDAARRLLGHSRH